MKKILALILATLMVMCALAACGKPAETNGTTAGAGTTTPTTGTTAGTTEATTATTEAPKPVEPYKAVCYFPFGESPKAVNVANGDVVGTITAADGVELKGGYLYVVDVVPADNKAEAIAEVGSFVAEKEVTAGWTNVKSNGSVTKYTSYILKDKASTNGSNGATIRKFMYNCYIDEAALNTAMGEYSSIGTFGTITLKMVDGDITSFVFDGGDEEASIIDYKWNFVYANYDGTAMNAATGTAISSTVMNGKDFIYSAIDKALGNEVGNLRNVWVTAMDTYGGLPSVLTDNGKYNGTSQQQANLGAFTNSLVPYLYTNAVAKYNTLIESGTSHAAVAKALEEANAALAAAQAALDAAVAANADVKALKDAYLAAEATYNEARQADYDARAAYETAKAQSGSSSDQAKALEPAYKEAAGKIFTDTSKRTGDGPLTVAYKEAKAAYEAALAADASIKALNDTLTTATADQKTAAGNQTTIDNYIKYAELYAKFTKAYDEITNVALWDVEDMENCALNKYFANIEADARAYPTFTYFYDAATETYTVFVSSATTANMVTFFSNNTAMKD